MLCSLPNAGFVEFAFRQRPTSVSYECSLCLPNNLDTARSRCTTSALRNQVSPPQQPLCLNCISAIEKVTSATDRKKGVIQKVRVTTCDDDGSIFRLLTASDALVILVLINLHGCQILCPHSRLSVPETCTRKSQSGSVLWPRRSTLFLLLR